MEDLGQTPHPTETRCPLEKWSSFPQTNLTPMHTFINMSNLGSLSRNISGMLCFVTFTTAAFTPELYFFTVFISAYVRLQNFKGTCVELHRNVHETKWHNFLMFFPLRHPTVLQSAVVTWWHGRYLQISGFMMGWMCYFSFGYLCVMEGQPLKESVKNQSYIVISLVQKSKVWTRLNWWLLNRCERVKAIK